MILKRLTERKVNEQNKWHWKRDWHGKSTDKSTTSRWREIKYQ